MPVVRASFPVATLVLAAPWASCRPAPAVRPEAVCLEHVALGEMGPDSAVLWARDDGRRFLHARVAGRDEGLVVPLLARNDHTARLSLRGLHAPAPELVLWASDGPSADERPPACAPRRVPLAPLAADTRPVRFGVGGDIGGQNVCRDAEHGFPTLATMVARPHDFRVLLGDLIYADDRCLADGALGNAQVPLDAPPLPSLSAYRAHWRYAEDDEAYRALRWGAYVVWDDHETLNDAGPFTDTLPEGRRGSDVQLLPRGRRGFLEHNALAIHPTDGSTPLHRRFRWGRQLDLVLLDTRSYRDDPRVPDDGAEPKSMLGPAQRQWLEDILRTSDARWIVIASSVPLAIPTGPHTRRDGWADGGTGLGYERELRGLLETARRAGRRRLVFVTTDVHFTAAFRYRPFSDDPGFEVHELVTGPLAAGLFPVDEVDGSLGVERLLFHVPETPVRTLAEARPYFTWGEVAIDVRGALTLSAWSADGQLWNASLASPTTDPGLPPRALRVPSPR